MTYNGSSDHNSADAPPDDATSKRANAMLVPVAGGGSARLRLRDIVRWPMPDQPSWRARTALRTFSALGHGQVRAIHGLEHLDPANEPFIFVLNHNIRREAVTVPPLLMLLRGGRQIHFLADWNFMLIPGLGWLIKHTGAIVVTRKSAGPFDVFRPLFRQAASSAEQMRAALDEGRSVGIFPEGTVTHDPNRLLYGRAGAARLSLEVGVPVVPAGIRFPDAPRDRPLAESEVMEVHIGAALYPPAPAAATPSLSESRAWHAVIMQEIARLSDKEWRPGAARDRKRGRDKATKGSEPT